MKFKELLGRFVESGVYEFGETRSDRVEYAFLKLFFGQVEGGGLTRAVSRI